ncbi:MAG: glycerophosphodiester phosphodiesterase family protein, partial [Myroides sp.]|nr:glycerophosphodiester phosphodiesterase family protein [Myroides sp.]
IIETDIAMTKDLVLVLMHDDKLDRTTTGTGFVSDYTYSELQEFYLKDYQKTKTSYKIPTLDEALQWGKGKVVYTLDVKRGVPYEKVIESIRKNNAEAYSIVITYNANQARAFHKLAPDIWLSVSANGKEDIQRLKEYKVNTDKVVAFVGTAEPSTQTIAYMKSQNIPMILGTLGNLDKSAKVNGDQLYYSFFEKGIQILSADRNKEASQQALKFANDNQIQSKFINIQ